MEQSKFYQIKNITEHEYTLVGCDGSVITRPIQDIDKSASVFTIKDAKEGDVLVSGNVIFIFNKIHGIWINCHCSLHKDGSFNDENYDLMTIKYSKEVYPTTEEQRDALFKAMADAGYEWDNEQKKLKKIESNPTWSEVDKDFMYDTLSNLTELKDRYGEGYGNVGKCIDWLKSLKDKIQPKQERE